LHSRGNFFKAIVCGDSDQIAEEWYSAQEKRVVNFMKNRQDVTLVR